MPAESHVATIAHVIQLAIAPVFLLSGVGTLLIVLTNRLGRIIDRARVVESQLEAPDKHRTQEAMEELARLAVRARLINLAIHFSTLCALLICVVIGTLFLGTFLSVDLSRIIGGMFIGSMLALFLALLSFLREIFVATRGLRIAANPPAAGQHHRKGGAPLVRE